MFLKKTAPFLLCLAVSLAAFGLARPASAQLGASDLPDLSGLAGAIEQSIKTPPPPPPKGKLFSSGMTVPSVHPGATATGIARQMRESAEKQGSPNPAMKELEAGMPAIITGLEAQMVKQGFAKRDLGVAMGLFFVGNWETATKSTLSDAAAGAVIRSVAQASATKWKARFAALSPAAKEKTYESLLTGTALLTIFAQSFETAGKTQEAAGMRQAAGALFEKVIGVPPTQVDIANDGRISGPAPTPPADAPPVDAPPVDAPPADAPPAMDAPPVEAPPADTPPAGKPGASRGAGVKPSQIAGVYAHLVQETGVGGYLYENFKPLLVLKDGFYCEDFDVAPSQFDAAASRRDLPRHWKRWRFNAAVGGGTWHGSAKHIQVLNSEGVWKTADWVGPLSGGGKSSFLSGTYSSLGGGGSAAFGGDMSFAYQNTYTFLPGGRFLAGGSTSVSSSSVAGGSNRTASGTYTLGNYALTLHFEDGAVQCLSYAHTTDPSDDVLYLRGSAYTKHDK